MHNGNVSSTAILQSAALGAAACHGFVTRAVGSLIAKWGDDPARVEENIRAVATGMHFDRERLFVARQVHGDHVHEVVAGESREAVAEIEADALITRVAGTTLAVSTADCTPILLFAPGIVGAAHAGWRGTVAEIGRKTLDAMRVDPRTVRAAIGPCLCVKCFEVGEEVAAQFSEEFVRRDLGAKPHVDLKACNAAALRRAGVDQIDVLAACTLHEPERFFSYRRELGKGGGHLSFIGL